MTAAATTPGPFPELARLLAPFPLEDFLRDYWEKEILHVERPQLARDPLVSLEEIDAIMTRGVHSHPNFQMVDAARETTVDDYTEATNIIDPVLVARRFVGGSTIVMNRLDEWSLRVRELVSKLEAELGIETQANMYLTPPDAQGFPVHYDNHDVIVVQCVGNKQWRLYDTPKPLPMRGERFVKETTPCGPLSRTLVMHPGDVLYVPRGRMHDAVNEGTGCSLHITLGFHTVRWSEVLIEAVAAQAVADVKLRHSLPLGLLAGHADDGPVREQFREHVRHLVETLDWETMLPRLVDRYVNARRDRVYGILVDSMAGYGPDTVFALREAVHVLMTPAGNELIMQVNGRETRWPARAESVLREVLEKKRFKLGDLDPSLDDRGKQTLLRRLIVEGLVHLAR